MPSVTRYLCSLVTCLLVTACTTEQLYQRFGSPPPQGPPTIYPLNFPVCPSNWGIVVIPLRMVVYKNSFPDPEYVAGLRKRYPDRDVCDIIRERYDRPPFRIERRDHWKGGGALDLSGNGYFAATHYGFNLMNDESFRKEAESKQRYEEFKAKQLIRDGFTWKEFVEIDETLTINGLEWRHRVVADCRITLHAHDACDPETKRDLYDLYEHRFDATHVFQISGYYGGVILAHPELLEDRRHMTRRLVEGFRYERITQTQIERMIEEAQGAR